MKKSFLIIMIFLCFVSFADDSLAGDEKSSDNSLIYFDLNIAPNTDGNIEGSVELDLLWSPWIYSGASFSSFNTTAVYELFLGSVTSVEQNKKLDIDILRTRSDFLKWKFGKEDFYILINGRLLLNLTWMNQKKYGYLDIPIVGFSLFYEKNNVFNIYPYGGVDMEFSFGPFFLNAYFLSSVMLLYTEVEGEFFYSITGNPEPSEFSFNDEGAEIRMGGTAAINPFSVLKLSYGFDYHWHRGYAYGALNEIAMTGDAKFLYDGSEFKHTLSFEFDLNGYKPVLGVSYISYSFKPLIDLLTTPEFSANRWSILFGLGY